MKVSIVVPVYNAEEHLPKLLSTLTEQTYSQIEIILVDNNSKDKSLDILKKWAKKDKRIQVLKEKKQGPNFARKTGFLHATGEYVYFCDSDDLVSKDAIEAMMEVVNTKKADVVIGKYNELNPDGTVHKTCDGIFFKDKTGNLKRYSDLILVKPALWNKLFRRSLITEDSFITSKIGEDMVITLTSITLAQKVYYVDHIIYHYIPAATGLTNSIKPNNLLDIMITCDALDRLIHKYDSKHVYTECLVFLRFSHVIYRILRSELILDHSIRKQVFEELHAYIKTIPYKKNYYYKKKIHYRIANTFLVTPFWYHSFIVRKMVQFLFTNRTLYRIFKILDQ